MAGRKTWSYLIRFLAREDGKLYTGDLAELPKPSQTSYAGLQARIVQGDPLGSYEVTSDVKTVAKLLSPIARESITLIRCVGLNYAAHVAEGSAASRPPEWPVLFIKSRMSLTDPETAVVIPKIAQDETCDYEGEIALVIAKDARDVPGSGDAWKQYVAGYACADDVTWRFGQKDFDVCGGQWCFGKGLDQFAPIGPALVHPSLFDPADVAIKTRLNGDTMQSARTKDLISNMPKILHHFTKGTTIEKGSIILTGTPEGVGYARKPRVYLKDGDELEVEVDGLGILRHSIKYE